jgi:hydroxypyruvate isomerase
MPRFAANLSFLYQNLPFLERFAAAAEDGFRAVEFLFPYEFAAERIAAAARKAGVRVVLFNLPPGDLARGERGLAALAGREAEFDAALERALDYADILDCPRLHAMAGRLEDGAQRATYVANLRKAARIAAGAGVNVLIEPINRRDIPGFFLNKTHEARSVIHEVAEPNLGLQFDLYHRQIEEGDVAMAIDEFGPLARHYQVASPPDRGEPDQGEMNYRWLFQRIDATGFTGWIGCEYRPRRGTLEGLSWTQSCGVTLG